MHYHSKFRGRNHHQLRKLQNHWVIPVPLYFNRPHPPCHNWDLSLIKEKYISTEIANYFLVLDIIFFGSKTIWSINLTGVFLHVFYCSPWYRKRMVRWKNQVSISNIEEDMITVVFFCGHLKFCVFKKIA